MRRRAAGVDSGPGARFAAVADCALIGVRHGEGPYSRCPHPLFFSITRRCANAYAPGVVKMKFE